MLTRQIFGNPISRLYVSFLGCAHNGCSLASEHIFYMLRLQVYYLKGSVHFVYLIIVYINQLECVALVGHVLDPNLWI